MAGRMAAGTPQGEESSTEASPPDYKWRFALERQAAARGYQDPLIEMIRAFLEDFLNIGFLTIDEKRIDAKGFAFTNDPKRIYRIFLDPVTNSTSINDSGGGKLDQK